MNRPLLSMLTFTAVLCLCGPIDARPPHLVAKGTATQLIVRDAPILIIGGQVHNSASSNAEYLDRVVAKLTQMHVNTVFAPVTWELLEPEEGVYDFGQLDSMIGIARKHGVKLIPLWFGSWKNGVSSYAPAWVRADQSRFPRAVDEKGQPMSALSTFGQQTLRADGAAFAAMMAHVRQIDAEENTVIMVQVENEVGLFQPRDHRPEADALFANLVPATLIDYLVAHRGQLSPHVEAVWTKNGARSSGRWNEVFGAGIDAEEIFMAWRYASYVGEVAASGKREYDIPLYVNAWLAGKDAPGVYPSGGPVHKVIDIWKAAAPAIAICAPDIYTNNFKEVCASFHRPDNPLFIPETHGDVWFTPAPSEVHQAARNVFWAFGHHDALGFSPFGLEGRAVDGPIAASFKVVSALAPLILQFQGAGRMEGILQTDEADVPAQGQEVVKQVASAESNRAILLGGYVANVTYSKATPDDRAYGLIIHTATDEFLIAGDGLKVAFASAGNGREVELAEVWEQLFVSGRWTNGRRLNGDETSQNSAVQLPFSRWDGFDVPCGPHVVRVRLIPTD